MPLTGNTYGLRVARVDVPVLLALDVGGGVQIWAAKIVSILDDGTPVIGRIGADAMTSVGYAFQATADAEDVGALVHGEWTWPLTNHVIVGLKSSALAADVSAVEADGWKTVHSDTYATVGGTSLSVQWAVVAAVTGGGKARVVVTGGSGAYASGVQIGPAPAFDAISGASIALFAPAPMPVTSPETTYTIEIQVQAAAGGSVAVNAASSPLVNGARLALVEYH